MDTVTDAAHPGHECTWKHKETGEPASVKLAHVWAIRDGKIVAFQQHVDTAKVRELS